MSPNDGKTMKRIQLHITGIVQGVGFRYHARREAASLNIAGFVRNLPDGSVEIEAQGNEDDLNRLIQWAHRGAPNAVVTRVVITDIPIKQEETGFSIGY